MVVLNSVAQRLVKIRGHSPRCRTLAPQKFACADIVVVRVPGVHVPFPVVQSILQDIVKLHT
jgi:hypothetical protein